MGERTEAPPVAEGARRASEKTRSIATDGARRLCFRVGNEKSHPLIFKYIFSLLYGVLVGKN